MSEQESPRKIFLESFTLELIRHSKRRTFSQNIPERAIPKKQLPVMQPVSIQVHPKVERLQPSIAQNPPRPPANQQYIPKPFMQRQPQRPIPRPGMPPRQQFPPRPSIATPRPTLPVTPAAPSAVKIENLSKIEGIIRDPLVSSIECIGAEKPLVISKSGMVQTAPFTFTSEEIKEVLKEISEKTKIPITPGIFKAALGEIIFTAVSSEYAGTRFIIQKK